MKTHQHSLPTTSITDRQFLRQKVHQKISVIKTNPCDDITKIVHFGIFDSRLVLKTTLTKVLISQIF